MLRGKSHCFLFESGLEHEAADFKTSFDIDGREALMVRDVKGLRHVHRHLLMLLGTLLLSKADVRTLLFEEMVIKVRCSRKDLA